MSRFQLTRGVVIYKGKRYRQGDFLPEDFTEKDRWHTIAPHSIVEVSEEQVSAEINAKAAPLTGSTPVGVAAKAAITPKNVSTGIKSAKVSPASQTKNPGTSPIKK